VLELTECASWFVANGLHVPPIAYKLRSPSDLIYGYPVTAGEDRLQPRDRLTGLTVNRSQVSCSEIYAEALMAMFGLC